MDLREWLPDRGMAWSSPEDVQVAYAAMIESMDAVLAATAPHWETMSELRRRGLEALRPYLASGRQAIAICHGVIIHALTGFPRTGHCEVREFVDGR
jgi:hypothetical protein